jgi:hypothetical protein
MGQPGLPSSWAEAPRKGRDQLKPPAAAAAQSSKEP